MGDRVVAGGGAHDVRVLARWPRPARGRRSWGPRPRRSGRACGPSRTPPRRRRAAEHSGGDPRLPHLGAGAGHHHQPQGPGAGHRRVGRHRTGAEMGMSNPDEDLRQLVELAAGVLGRHRDPQACRARGHRRRAGWRGPAGPRPGGPRTPPWPGRPPRVRPGGSGDGCPGRRCGRCCRAAAPAGGCPPRNGPTASAAAAAAAAGGGVAVLKMNGRAVLTMRSIAPPVPTTNPPREPSILDRVPTMSTVARGSSSPVAPNTSWAVSSTSRASCRAHIAESSCHVDDVAVHGEHDVGDHHGLGPAAAGQSRFEGLEVDVGVHVGRESAESGAVDDRGMVELVGEHHGVAWRRPRSRWRPAHPGSPRSRWGTAGPRRRGGPGASTRPAAPRAGRGPAARRR